MKNFLRRNWPILLIVLLINAGLIVISQIHIEYDVTSPAYLTEVQTVIEIENAYEQKGSFNTTSVYFNERTTVLRYLLAKLSIANIIEESSPIVSYTSTSRNTRSGVFQKNISLENALITAYKAAGCHLDYTYDGIIIHTLANYATYDLEVGDVISKVDGKSFTSTAEFKSLYDEARMNPAYFNVEEGVCHLPLTVNGSDKIVTSTYILETSDGTKYPVFGFYYYDCYTIDESSADPKYKLKEVKTTGPSGGLLQTLAIFNALTEFDYTYGLKIAGTGTIDVDGKVGSIGGMTSKIYTAYYSGVRIFFVPYVESDDPSTNYNEAIAAYQKLGSPKDFKIVGVKTFQDAVDYLRAYGEAYD